MVELHGILVVDKPRGLSSAQVVDEVKRRLGIARAGHTGTLDPLATGVLAICLGEATKLAGWMIAEDKAYEAELELGVTTDTLDASGTVIAEDRAAGAAVTTEQVGAALARLAARTEQVPPMFSAIRQGKRRLHQLARAGEVVDRAPRPITIHQLDLLELAPPRARLAITCSKGTYVRSLVDDLGRDLGCGAHLTALRRTRSGLFTLAQAIPLDEVTVQCTVVRASDALGLPRVQVPADLLRAVHNAWAVPLLPLLQGVAEGEQSQLVGEGGDLLAIVRRRGGRVEFERVFARP
jgi:tRNA pseudouridine55 synthase